MIRGFKPAGFSGPSMNALMVAWNVYMLHMLPSGKHKKLWKITMFNW
jgi:hypothetical protein